MKSLPYLRACIKESTRLNPVTIGMAFWLRFSLIYSIINFLFYIGGLRSAGKDLVLQGYRIPKGVYNFKYSFIQFIITIFIFPAQCCYVQSASSNR